MALQWILLAFFLMAVVRNVAKAMRNPMLKNILRLISLIVAFIITLILQYSGVFQGLISLLVEKLELASKVPEFQGVVANAIKFLLPFCTTILSPLIFVLVFHLIFLILRLVHGNLTYAFIISRRRKKEIIELKKALAEEKKVMKQAITDNEERFLSVIDQMAIDNPEIGSYEYESLTEEEIDRLVKNRVKEDKKRRKKEGFFAESADNKAVSIICGVVCGFLLFGINWMGMFHTMDVLSGVTDGIKGTNADDTKIYQIVEMVDKQIVDPYEDSFVYKFYDSMGVVDLMNSTVRAGGKLDINGETLYADDIMRDHMTRSIRLACELTSDKSEQSHIGEDVSALADDPIVVSLLADVIVELLEDVDPEEFDRSNPLTPLLGTIVTNYKDKEVIINDMHAVSAIAVVAAENKLLPKLIAENTDYGELLGDRELIKDMIGAVSALSVYAPAMESAVSTGVGTVGPMLMPSNNAEAYESFVAEIISASENITALTDEDLAELKNLFVDVAEFTKNQDQIAYLEDKQITYGLTDEELLKLDELKAEVTQTPSIWDYISEPIHTIELIGDQANEVSQMILDKEDDIRLLEEQITTATPETLPELEAQLADLEAELQVLLDRDLALADRAELLVEDFDERVKGFAHFLTYFMNWTNVQKPFMLANEDTSTACLAMNIGGVIYVCNTDILTIESILDFIENADDLPTDDEGDAGSGEGGEGSEEDIFDLDADDFLANIPMSDLLGQLTITAATSSSEGHVSELTDLINYIIGEANTTKNASGSINDAWLYTVLGSYDNASDEAGTLLAQRIVDAEYNADKFDYKGVTVEQMQASLVFGEEWTEEAKAADSEKLVDIIFTLLDLMNTMNNEGGDDMASEDSADVEKILGLLVTLGDTMDQMADTTCLGNVPEIMVEGILKNKMLSMAMTPSMIYGEEGYLSRVDSGELTYKELMEEISQKVTDILDRLNNEEEETV